MLNNGLLLVLLMEIQKSLEIVVIYCERKGFKNVNNNHKLHGSQFDNNSHANFAFHRFIWNRHECHLPTCIV
jgi:hypothetical protein